MSDQSTILEARQVYKSYRMGTTRVRVLKGVDLEIGRGEFLAVVGASGSGKSTLLHLLGGLDQPDQGSIRYAGRPLTGLGGRGLNRFRNRTVGFVFQFYYLLDELNVLENVLMPAMAGCSVPAWWACRRQTRQRARTLIEMMGLGHRLCHKPYELSGGERQRVAIARALINRPDLLLADEPTGNLDSATGNSILRVFEQLHRDGQTIVMVTHDNRIAQEASRVITLTDGKTAPGQADE